MSLTSAYYGLEDFTIFQSGQLETFGKILRPFLQFLVNEPWTCECSDALKLSQVTPSEVYDEL